jgi:hypothetical protein
MTDHEQLRVLIQAITESADDEGRWEITSEQVEGLLAVDRAQFWRSAYAVRDRIAFGDAIDGWSYDTVGDLITVLEKIMGPAAEQEMARAGLFLPHEWGVELTEDLLSRARRFSAGHDIRGEEWAAMLRYTSSVSGALQIYFGEYIAVDGLVAGCAESYQALRDLPEIAAATATLYIKKLFARHILETRALFALLEERLRAAAVELGFMDMDERARARTRPTREREPARRAWARRVMGVEQEEMSAEALRARYRLLMMRYHPDADPSGLERCKDVNVAYSLLIAEVAGN